MRPWTGLQNINWPTKHKRDRGPAYKTQRDREPACNYRWNCEPAYNGK